MLKFIPDLPSGYSKEPIVISGSQSLLFSNNEYILHTENDNPVDVYEIRYEYHCSPFKEAVLADNILAVGYESSFYLFDISSNKNLLSLYLGGYFCHLYIDEGHCYVTDAIGLYSIDKAGKILWSNTNLGIDGVLIKQFTNTEIRGSGEWDPPGGWRDFTIDRKTGQLQQN